jgi:MoaA/NifB/PqqE/SkfB family radical SAM enzyme
VPVLPHRSQVTLGLAVTEHCNLRCPHCIRDDVTTVRSLEPDLIATVLDQARARFHPVTASLTGGEPLLHPEFERIVGIFAERRVPYRFVTNGWHFARVMPTLDRYPPQAVRLSLSGGSEAVHDAERGRGSFRRVLLAVGLLTSRRIPAALSVVVDRRDRHELREAADLAEALGCVEISFILPQPVPGSAARDSDLAPEEWMPVRRDVAQLAAEPGRRTRVRMDYGAPFEGAETPCDTFAARRIYVDTRGRLCTCCQLSNYGFNEDEVVADLHEVPLEAALAAWEERLTELRRAQQPAPHDPHVTDPFPCLRCARTNRKLDWLRDYPISAWHAAAEPATVEPALPERRWAPSPGDAYA